MTCRFGNDTNQSFLKMRTSIKASDGADFDASAYHTPTLLYGFECISILILPNMITACTGTLNVQNSLHPRTQYITHVSVVLGRMKVKHDCVLMNSE